MLAASATGSQRMFTRKKDGSLLYAPLPKELERFVNQLQEAKVPIKGLPFLSENTKWHEDVHILKGEGVMSGEDWENIERIRRNSENAAFSAKHKIYGLLALQRAKIDKKIETLFDGRVKVSVCWRILNKEGSMSRKAGPR
jgi:hypothetical protein